MPRFVVKTGPDAGRVIEMRAKSLRFGRSQDSDVVVNDPGVSRNHAMVTEINGLIMLTDFSSNGTFVNNIPISRTVLMDNDEIRMGSTVFVFEDAPSEVGNVSGTECTGLAMPVSSTEEERRDNSTRLLPDFQIGIDAGALKEVYLKLKTVYRILSDIAESSSLRSMLEIFSRAALLALGGERVTCYLWSESAEALREDFKFCSELVSPYTSQLANAPEHFLKEAFNSSEPLLAKWDDHGRFIPEHESPNVVALQLRRDQQAIGVVCIDNPHGRRTFTKDDVDFLQTLIGLVNLRVYQLTQMENLRQEIRSLRQKRADDFTIVCQNERMKEIYQKVAQAAQTDATVLIVGETGTGKELVARSIHALSPRRNKEFVAVNCAAFTETLIESELFGHERGAFTGAFTQRKGKFEQAHGGTIFLDEIGEMSPNVQAKLLRVLEQREIQRVGGEKSIKVDVRIIAATNKNLKEEVRKGNFREDLYYRICVVEIALPPLRERVDEIPALAQHFFEKLRKEHPTTLKKIAPETLEVLKSYPFPGNVRELKNIIERAVVCATGDTLLPQHLGNDILEAARRPSLSALEQKRGESESQPFRAKTLAELEREHILRTVQSVPNKVKAAEILGISRTTLYEKLKEYGIGTEKEEEGHN